VEPPERFIVWINPKVPFGDSCYNLLPTHRTGLTEPGYNLDSFNPQPAVAEVAYLGNLSSPTPTLMIRQIIALIGFALLSLNLLAERPNVVIVITDDQGYGDLSVHGNPILKTPELDRLHGESIRLTDYHVSPTCAPTRGAMHSGHYTNRAGPWHTIKGRSFLRVGETTLGETFSAAGYGTGMFGKWHLGDNYPYRPKDRGFTETVVHSGGGVGQTPDIWDNAYFDDVYHHNGVAKRFEGYCTDVYFSEAQRFMEEENVAGRPFLAMISTNAPHSPFHAPDKYWKPYAEAGISDREALFFGMIANIDENVGKLRDWLASEGLAENTIFIFTTDNGTASGENIFGAGMRGKKGSEYDGGHRVPFFLHWPAGELAHNRDVTELTAHIDLLPTLMELCAVKGPKGYKYDGKSIAPLLRQEDKKWPNRVVITDSQRVVDPIKWRKSSTMTSRWRLINGTELYDMRKDPSQAKDVAEEFPKVVARLRKAYDKWWDDISPSFSIDERIVVGHPAENPSQLTAHDWLNDDDGPTPWHQSHIRAGLPSNGWWAVRVAESGRYRISLRRWPLSVEKPLNAALAPGAPVPGLTAFRETPGLSIDVVGARLEVAGQTYTTKVNPEAEAAVFEVDLKAGETTLQGIFETRTEKRAEIGSYYAVVERL
jgi:arylsulfatase B